MDRSALDVQTLRSALGPRWPRIEVVAQTGSTNADLLAQPDAPDHSVLVAEAQTAGRGRLGRTWTSTPGAGLTFSVLLRPAAPIATWGWLPLLTGVALHAAVGSLTGADVALKWPNDLLVPTASAPSSPARAPGPTVGAVPTASAPSSPPRAPGPTVGAVPTASAPSSPPRAPGPTVGAVPAPTGPVIAAVPRKLDGVLAQTSGPAVVIGVGLNVSTTAQELPVDTATSLALCGVSQVDRGALLVAILTDLFARLARWEGAGGDAEACGVAAEYRAVCATLGQAVAVSVTDSRVVRGTARAIDSAGRLIIATDAGDEVIGAGDVHHLRPAQ